MSIAYVGKDTPFTLLEKEGLTPHLSRLDAKPRTLGGQPIGGPQVYQLPELYRKANFEYSQILFVGINISGRHEVFIGKVSKSNLKYLKRH